MQIPKKFLIALSLSLVISGCSFLQPKIVEVPVYVEKPIPVVPRPRQITLQKVKFDVVSVKNLEEFLTENKREHGNTVFIALDVTDYENLALNVAELKRYIVQLLYIVTYYEEAIKPKEEEK